MQEAAYNRNKLCEFLNCSPLTIFYNIFDAVYIYSCADTTGPINILTVAYIAQAADIYPSLMIYNIELYDL